MPAPPNGELPVPPEPTPWVVPEQTLPEFIPSSAASGNTIIIDNGSSRVRAGWAGQQNPSLSFPPVMSRYRDRKFARNFTFVGDDAYVDQASRGQMRGAFEAGSGIVGNWDVMEGILDYVFLKLGVGEELGHIVMTEPLANLGYSRRMMTEILFECYNAPSVAYGVDALFSHYFNGGKTSLVVSSSNSSTHVLPVVNGKGMLAHATRLNWGRQHGVDYLQKLLQLKYPTFPGKMVSRHVEAMVNEHCYISKDYVSELNGYLDWTGLENRDIVVQFPYTEQIVVEKTEEELARIAEKKQENIRRLKEQAAKSRLEKLKKKEEELAYYQDVQARGANMTKKDFKRLLESAEVADENQLEKTIKELEKSISKARQKDLGGPEIDEPEEEPTFPLLEIPDEELDEAGLKQKRHQKLMKSNHDARQRARAEKEKEKERKAEIARLDEERRTNDLEGWVADHRAQREAILTRMKERQRLKADLSNRKSLASQMRMKSIANLASDSPTGKKRRRNGAAADDDDFGANDDDWGIYRSIAIGGGESDEENEDEELQLSLQKLEAKLLEYDPDFEAHHTLDAQSDWTKSLVHRFLRGPWPYEDTLKVANQMHLNVERIRVPEVIFRPSLAGLDQAGVVEIASDILLQRMSALDIRRDLLKDVFLTGGNTQFKNFQERFRDELRAVLPEDLELHVRSAKDPILDAWRGACQWSGTEQARLARITRKDYEEKGGEYLKEHNLGNAFA